MRELYTSPRPENIDRVVALLAEDGIEAKIEGRSVLKRSTYQRFSYTQKQQDRSAWEQVWVTRADDYARARAKIKALGIEPVVRFGDELAASRQPAPQRTASRIRLMTLAVVVGVFLVVALRMIRFI
jgi:hypothetical protein